MCGQCVAAHLVGFLRDWLQSRGLTTHAHTHPHTNTCTTHPHSSTLTHTHPHSPTLTHTKTPSSLSHTLNTYGHRPRYSCTLSSESTPVRTQWLEHTPRYTNLHTQAYSLPKHTLTRRSGLVYTVRGRIFSTEADELYGLCHPRVLPLHGGVRG